MNKRMQSSQNINLRRIAVIYAHIFFHICGCDTTFFMPRFNFMARCQKNYEMQL